MLDFFSKINIYQNNGLWPDFRISQPLLKEIEAITLFFLYFNSKDHNNPFGRRLLERASTRLKPCKLLTYSLPLKSRLAECGQSLIRAGLNTILQCEDSDQPIDNLIGFGREPNTQIGKGTQGTHDGNGKRKTLYPSRICL